MLRSIVRLKWKEKSMLSSLTLTMPEYAYKQDSENALGPKCAKILNMAKLWICQGSQYVSVTQRSGYAYLNMPWQIYLRFLMC